MTTPDLKKLKELAEGTIAGRVMAFNRVSHFQTILAMIEQIEKLEKALWSIIVYRKRTDHEDDYQSMISMMAIAGDAVDPVDPVDPEELVCSKNPDLNNDKLEK